MSSTGGWVQGDEGGEPGGDPTRWWTPRRAVAALAALAVVATIPFGGLRTVDPTLTSVVRLNVDEVNKGGPWNVTVTGGRLLKDQPPLDASVKGNRWVIILATVEITSDETRNDIDAILRISGAEGLVSKEPTEVRLLRDYTAYPALHPGIPERMIFGWEQSAAAPVPTRVDVTIWGKTLRLDSFRKVPSWLDDAERAVVTVPIVDRRNA